MSLPPSARQAFGRRLWRLADLEQASRSRRSFESRAFRQAVWALDSLSPDLVESRTDLLSQRGVGPVVASMIEEFRTSGDIDRARRLEETLPAEAPEMSRLTGMTTARLKALKELGVDDLQTLGVLLATGEVGIRGVGPATIKAWHQRLDAVASVGMPILRAKGWAERFADHLAHHFADGRPEVVGAVRRLDEWADCVELLAQSELESVERFLRASALTLQLKTQGRRIALSTLVGPVEVHVPKRVGWGAAMLLTTGPPEHRSSVINAAATSAWRRAESEEMIYAFAGSPPIPAPARGELFPPPPWLSDAHLRGDFHVHTDGSPDGRQSLEEVVAEASRRGWDYVAITDHTHGLRFGGLDADGLARQADAIDEARARHPGLLILHGAELNIDKEGGVDIEDEDLAKLDFAIAGIHSSFNLAPSEQTRRLCRVAAHPLVNAIAHPTGRRIGVRPPIEFDLVAVSEVAAREKTALEINGHLDRLDLPAALVGLAISTGVTFLINSDSHRSSETRNLTYGVMVGQKAGLMPSQVANSWPRSAVVDWLAQSRPALMEWREHQDGQGRSASRSNARTDPTAKGHMAP